ncbi:MAG: long-chain fatty acid--CoA ligase [Lentimicrobium sp.]|nr:long-chain fatty acid--CoA ligase [Lentimicrobium sp.]
MANPTRIFDLLDHYHDEYAGKNDVFGYKKEGNWITVSAADYLKNANTVSYGLMAIGLKPGSRVATIMGNRPEWNFLDMGILQAGCVHVPVYPTISAENYLYIFNDAEIKVLFIGCHEAYNRVKTILHLIPSLQAFYILEKTKGVKHWSVLLEKGRKFKETEVLASIKSSIQPSDLATLIYTSGTTGKPKGVMLSHSNIISNCLSVSEILKKKRVSKALSFLPLCHVYERLLNYMYQHLGISVYYAEHIDRIRDNMKDVSPDMFCAVPRVLEKSYATIIRKGRNLKGIRKIIFFWALNLGHRYDFELAGKLSYRTKLQLADKLVFNKWRLAFGNKLKIIVSGGAPLHPRLARVFWAAGIQVIEGYGLTETSPVIAVGTFEPDGVKFGTVGKILKGVEVKLSADDEILVKGPNVMMGYLNRPDRNAEVFDEEGWFHTGDIGEIIDGEYLKITDRKKEIFKTSLGKYIAPQVIENRMKESPFIESVMVSGENRSYPSALIVPNFEYLKSWCGAKEIEYTSDAEMARQKVVQDRILQEVNTINSTLDHTSQVRKFIIMNKPWTVQSGELSPTLKVRRKFMHEKYADLIASMYGVEKETPRYAKKRNKKDKKNIK